MTKMNISCALYVIIYTTNKLQGDSELVGR